MRDFTLVEMLVVISILAVLSALLFPVFSRAKKAAKGSTCLSNLRQIGEATMLYSNDSDDLFPNMGDSGDRANPGFLATWPEFMAEVPEIPLVQDLLQSYLKSRELFHCPADTGSALIDSINFSPPFPGRPSDYAAYGRSYFYESSLTARRLTLTSLTNPAGANLHFDMAGHWHSSDSELLPDDNLEVAAEKRQEFRYNCVFVDMHEKSLTSVQFSTGLLPDLGLG